MSSDQALTLVRECITCFKDIKSEDIQLESSLSGDLCLDSQDRLELLFNLEDKLKRTFPMEEYTQCQTIADLVALINLEEASKEVQQ